MTEFPTKMFSHIIEFFVHFETFSAVFSPAPSERFNVRLRGDIEKTVETKFLGSIICEYFVRFWIILSPFRLQNQSTLQMGEIDIWLEKSDDDASEQES